MHSLVSHAQRSSVMQTVMILISCSVSLRIESRTWCHPRDIGWSLAVISDCISTISTSGSCHLNHHHCHPPGYLDHHQPGSPCLHHTPPDNIWMQLGVELKNTDLVRKLAPNRRQDVWLVSMQRTLCVETSVISI